MKQMEGELSLMQNQIRPVQKIIEVDMGSYGGDKTLRCKRVDTVTKYVPTRFVEMVLCVYMAITNWCMREIY